MDDGDGDGDDGGDGDNEAPTWKTAVKRKAPKKKKEISVKKKQRKSVPITSLDEEDPLESPYSPRYKPTLEDFTLGYPPTPYDQFTLVYTPTHVEDMLHPPPSWHRTRSPFQQPPPPMSSRHEPQSRAPLTDVTDQSLHVQEVGTSTAKEVAPTMKKEVAGLVLISGILGSVTATLRKRIDRSELSSNPYIANLNFLTRQGHLR
ncbi:hypothetical protein LWI28_024354 [Acer negundo]|uniref:Uncharacterized protein n=1 Tax=Acer negundo TaxID=4023 RepID=A0AAD5IX40_ACENE|nr:hypothetical protein LWI28_024354 [Acer negundo]